MRLRVMTYNIKAGRHHPDGLEAAARLVEAHAPDLLGLQEVDEGMARTNHISQTDWLSRRLRMRGLYAPALELDGGLYGIALLSRLPVRLHERRLLYRPNYPDAEQRPRHDSEQRAMLGVLIDSSALSRETSASDSISVFKVIVTHLGLTPDQREVQIRQVTDFARLWQGNLPTMIIGDFNCDPSTPETTALRAHFQDVCEAAGVQGDARFTFPSGRQGARTANGWRGAIDHAWVSPDIAVVSAQVIFDASLASDHQPLLFECEVAPPQRL